MTRKRFTKGTGSRSARAGAAISPLGQHRRLLEGHRGDVCGLVGAVVARVNQALDRIGEGKEQVADFIVATIFGRHWAQALDPERSRLEAWVELKARAGEELALPPAQLSRYVRIGALNRALKNGDWANVGWTKKIALLPLLAADPELRLLRRGVRYALPEHRSAAAVTRWVQDCTVDLVTPGRPRGPTFSFAETMVAVGVKLGDDGIRERFVKRIYDVEPERRAPFLAELRQTIANFQAVLDEVEAVERADGP